AGAGAAPGGEPLGAAAGVQGVRQRLRAPAGPDRAGGAAAGLSAAVVEPAPADLLPGGSSTALLSGGPTKSESGCSDPPRRQARPRRKDGGPWSGRNVA